MVTKGSLGERIAIVLICFGYMTLASTTSVLYGLRTFEYNNEAVLEVMGLEIFFAITALLVLQRRGWTRADFGAPPSFMSTLGGIVLFPVVMLLSNISYIVMYRSGALEGWPPMEMRNTAEPVLLVLFLVVNSFYEETFVTGYLIEASRGAGIAHAVSVSTLVRLLYHTYQGPMALAHIIPIGLVFGYVYARSRNLWPLIVAHTLINLLALAQQWMSSRA